VDPGHPTRGIGSAPDTRPESHPRPGPEEGADMVFHPIHHDRLRIGTCGDDGTDVWITLTPRQAGRLHPLFYDSAGKQYANKASTNIIWHEEFKSSQFAGIEGEQERARHDYLYGIIQSQKGRSIPPPRQNLSQRTLAILSNPAPRMRVPAVPYAGPPSENQTGRQARRSTMAASIPPSPPPAVNNKRWRDTMSST